MSFFSFGLFAAGARSAAGASSTVGNLLKESNQSQRFCGIPMALFFLRNFFEKKTCTIRVDALYFFVGALWQCLFF